MIGRPHWEARLSLFTPILGNVSRTRRSRQYEVGIATRATVSLDIEVENMGLDHV